MQAVIATATVTVKMDSLERYTTDVDDCQGINCQNGGTCLDGINSYIWSCPDGFQGDNCENDGSC